MSAVIVKKDEKIQKIFELIGYDCGEESFINKFKELYPKDWDNIQAKFVKEERATKPGKSHPMPHPDVYMKNLYKVAMAKQKGEK